MLGYQELIVIFLIVLLLFGGRKIPEIARGLGRGIREFKKARDDIRDAIEREERAPDMKPATTPTGPNPEDEAAADEEAAAAGDGQQQQESPKN